MRRYKLYEHDEELRVPRSTQFYRQRIGNNNANDSSDDDN